MKLRLIDNGMLKSVGALGSHAYIRRVLAINLPKEAWRCFHIYHHTYYISVCDNNALMHSFGLLIMDTFRLRLREVRLESF